MTEPPPTPPQSPPAAGDTRLFRREPEGPVAGVATGLAKYFDVDPVLIQVAIVCFAIATGGGGLLAYAAAWVFVPEVGETTSTKRFEIKKSVSTASIVSLFIGGLIVIAVLGDQSGSLIVPGILVAGGFYFLNQRSAEPRPAFVPPPPGTATPPPPSAEPANHPNADPYAWAVPKIDAPPPPQASPPTEPEVETGPTPPITAVTMAAIAAGIALLSLINGLFNIGLHAAAFIGMATAIIGLGMIVASVMGRARALIPLGLLSIFFLISSPVIEAGLTGGFGPREIVVRNEASLEDAYTLGAGYLELDLRPLTLSEDQTVTVDVGAGAAEIRVPSGVNVEVVATNDAGYVGVAPPALEIGEPDFSGPDFDPDFGGPDFEIEFNEVVIDDWSNFTWTSEEVAGTDNNYRWSQVVNDGPTLTINANVSYGSLEISP